jgi:hypothetical protein
MGFERVPSPGMMKDFKVSEKERHDARQTSVTELIL